MTSSLDEGILELIRKGDTSGVELLYDRYGRLAYTLAFRIPHDSGAAEDIVQEAFVDVWRGASTYQSERGSARAWICSVVHNRSIDRLRGKSGKARLVLPLESASDHAETSDVWQQVAASLDHARVAAALAELSSDQREAIELAYYQGYSQSEIGAMLMIPLGTVKGRMRLALQRLRESLGSTEWAT